MTRHIHGHCDLYLQALLLKTKNSDCHIKAEGHGTNGCADIERKQKGVPKDWLTGQHVVRQNSLNPLHWKGALLFHQFIYIMQDLLCPNSSFLCGVINTELEMYLWQILVVYIMYMKHRHLSYISFSYKIFHCEYFCLSKHKKDYERINAVVFRKTIAPWKALINEHIIFIQSYYLFLYCIWNVNQYAVSYNPKTNISKQRVFRLNAAIFI